MPARQKPPHDQIVATTDNCPRHRQRQTIGSDGRLTTELCEFCVAGEEWRAANRADVDRRPPRRSHPGYTTVTSLVPIGLPNPVQASHPGPAANPLLLPSVMSRRAPAFA